MFDIIIKTICPQCQAPPPVHASIRPAARPSVRQCLPILSLINTIEFAANLRTKSGMYSSFKFTHPSFHLFARLSCEMVHAIWIFPLWIVQSIEADEQTISSHAFHRTSKVIDSLAFAWPLESPCSPQSPLENVIKWCTLLDRKVPNMDSTRNSANWSLPASRDYNRIESYR